MGRKLPYDDPPYRPVNPPMDEEQRERHLEALKSERRGYENRGEEERVAEVDAEIKRIVAEEGAQDRRTQRQRAQKRA